MEQTSLFRQILKSKTMLAATVIEILGVIQANSDFLSTIMPPNYFGFMLIAIGITMRLLRMVTTSSIGEK